MPRDPLVARGEERRRVLDLLALGTINVEQAASLLKALGPSKEETLPLPPAAAAQPTPPLRFDMPQHPTAPAQPRVPKPKFVRIRIDASKGDGNKDTKVNVTVPIALAKFALRFVPAEAKAEMQAQGIDVAQLLEGFDTDYNGKILDLDAAEDDGKGTTHITIEVI